MIGESAGGSAVQFLASNRQVMAIAKKFIPLSGSFVSYWNDHKDTNTTQLIQSLDLNNQSQSYNVLRLLRSVKAKKFVSGVNDHL